MESNSLNSSDRASTAALKLKEIYLARLGLLRRQNDNDLDEKTTATRRGQIKEVKRLLRALGHVEPKAPKVADDD